MCVNDVRALHDIEPTLLRPHHTLSDQPGIIPDCIGTDLTSLELLELTENKLVGTIPESLCEIGESLTELTLYSNSLTGRRALVCQRARQYHAQGFMMGSCCTTQTRLFFPAAHVLSSSP